MNKTFLFPGQGSQKVGMGSDFFEQTDEAKKIFAEANEIAGFDIAKLCFDGPEEELTKTQNTQPALFTVECIISDILQSKGIMPSVTMGHSLGEYAALYSAGVYSFADGLRLVLKRGQLMSVAGKDTPGTMAAVIGLSKEVIADVLSNADGVVVPANENSPEQTVISGEISAIEAIQDTLKDAGAKRVVLLSVSGAFHSPLMQSVADEFTKELDSVTFNTAKCPVISNVSAKAETDPNHIKDLLVKQLISPVRWVDSMAYIKENNSTDCVEVGPGNVLKGLARKCDREIKVLPCNTVDNLYSLLEK